MVCKKIVPSKGSHLKVIIKSTKETKCLLFGVTKNRISTFVVTSISTGLPLLVEQQFT